MSRIRIALVAGLVLLAVCLALVGLSVLRTSANLQAREEALAAGGVTVDPDVSSPSASERVGDRLLGTSEERSYLDALLLARASALADQPEEAVLERRAQAEAMLGPIVAGNGDPILRSRAANLLGVLFFEDAKAAKQSPRRYLDQSLGAFQNAVRLDPSYGTAKANLALLQLLPPGTAFRQEGVSGGSNASSGSSGESGY